MSKHPDNPWWDQEFDRPVLIMTQEEWDDAAEAGHITPEHVMMRLEAMLGAALGDPSQGAVAFDEDGFVTALVGDGWRVEDCRLQMYTDDHDPPHLHYWLKGDRSQVVRISLESGEPLPNQSLPPKLRKNLKKKVQPFIQSKREAMWARWDEIQAGK